MLRNYLKIALRNFLKYKTYSIINIIGLGLGIACCILIVLFVQNEISYDKYHENLNRIYRVIGEEINEGLTRHLASTYGPLAPAMLTDFPEIDYAIRFFPYSITVRRGQGRLFQEDRFFFSDEHVLDVFSFKLLQGNRDRALSQPNSVLVTEATARKYFGDESPLGQTLTLENNYDVVVTGVLENTPSNSHFSFDILGNIKSVDTVIGTHILDPNSGSWFWPPFYTYVMLPNGYDPERIESRFPELIRKHIGDWAVTERAFYLQPLKDIYLRSELESEIEPVGKLIYIYIFSLIAVFVLLIACINFINLATARSANRAREVGLRKVVGAGKNQLIRQFLGESLFFAVLAMFFAILVVELFMPTFKALIGRELAVDYSQNDLLIFGLPGLTLLVGVIAGIYPALFISNFRPIQALQNKINIGSGGKMRLQFRSYLVITQFIVSVILIIVTIIVNRQLNFIQTERLGFNNERLVVMPIRDEAIQNSYNSFKNEFLSLTVVSDVTAISNLPWEQGFYDFPIKAENLADQTGMNMPTLIVDHDFVETMKMEIVSGRDFSKVNTTDQLEGFILNESAVKKIGWDSPIGKKIQIEHVTGGLPRQGRVIGVVKDFHLRSFHFKIEPLVIIVSPRPYYLDNVAVRLNSGDIPGALGALQAKWQELVPNRPFDYFFLDEAFDRLYRKEEQLGTIFKYFSGFTILVGCLGLFGLASFSAEQRTKEISVRKVLGASSASIAILLARHFSVLVLIASLIAAPIAAIIMKEWLQAFSYRIDLELWIFFLSAAIVLGFALVTVSYQSVRAALTNPADTLRCE